MYRADLRNLISLAAIQVSNALIPLLVFPYVLTVVGAEAYAKLAMSEATAIAAIAIVLYSFEVDGASRVIKLNWKEERIQVARIFSGVLYARLFIFFICASIALISYPFLDSEFADFLLIWLLIPLSYAIQPSWLFQAIESNSRMAIFTVASRALSAIFIYFFVKKPVDALLVPAIMACFYLTSALASLLYAHRSLGLRLQKVPIPVLMNYLWDGRKIFTGNLAVVLYRDLNVVILGIAQVAAGDIATYSIAEKLIKGLQATMRPFNQIYFPKTLKLLGQSKRVVRNHLKIIWPSIYPQLAALCLILISLITVAIVVTSKIPLGKSYPEIQQIAILCVLMIPATFFGIANFMLGIAGLNFLNEQTYMYKSILVTGIASIFLCYLLSIRFDVFGAALAFSLAEGFLLILILKRFLSAPSTALTH